MRLFAKRYLLLTALIAAAVCISDVNAKSRIRNLHDHDKNSVHENHFEHIHHKRSYSSSKYPSSSGLSGSGKADKHSHSSSNSKVSSLNKPSYPSSGGLSGSRNGHSGISHPAIHKPVSKPISSYNKTHGYGSGNRHPGSSPSTNSGNSYKPVSYPTSNGISGNERKNLTAPHSAKLTYYPPSNGLSGGSRNNTGSSSYKPVVSYPTSSGLSGNSNKNTSNWTNQVSSNQKPGPSYPSSHGLSGGGSRPSVYYQTTPKPNIYPSSKIPPTSSFGNHTNQGVIPPKNVSGSYQKPGPLYPPSHGLSGGGSRPSGSYQTTPKPVIYPSSKIPPTSSFGNRTIQGVIPPKNVSGSNQKPGTSYPPSHGLSGGGSGPYQTTHKPASYPPSIKPPVNNPNFIYQPVVVHHIHSYESHSSFLPHQQINTYRPAYVYAPPHIIQFKNAHGSYEEHPVYSHHNVPPYVNDYRQSENKYRNLLSGLALYNLGMISHSHSKNEFHKKYVQGPDEICTFEAKYKKGNTDEMAIDCIVMTYFIFMDEFKNRMVVLVAPGGSSGINNDTQVMLPDGTLVSDKVAYQLKKANSTIPLPQIMRPDGTTVYRASEPVFNGKPVSYKLLKECNIGRSKLFLEFKKEIPCGLLQTYAEKSWRANSGPVLKSSLTVILIAVCVFFM